MSRHHRNRKLAEEAPLAETSLSIRELEVILGSLELSADYGVYDEQGLRIISNTEINQLINKLSIVEAIAEGQLNGCEPTEEFVEESQRMYDLMEGADTITIVTDELDGTEEFVEE